MAFQPTNPSLAQAAAASVGLVSVPAVLIRLDLESRPRVVCDFTNTGDRARMDDWLGSHPELRDLVVQALALERAA